MDRPTLAVIAVTAALTSAGTAVAGQFANPQPADAGPRATAASDAQIVRELRTLNGQVGRIGKPLSLNALTYEGFNDLYRAMAESCRALGGGASCPSFSH